MPFSWPRFLWTMLKLHVTHPHYSLIGTPPFIKKNMKRWTDRTANEWAKVDMNTMSAAELFEFELMARGDSEFLPAATLPFSIYLFVLPAALRTLCASWPG